MWLMTYDDIWHSVSSTIEIKLILVIFSEKEIRPAFKWLMTCDIWHSPSVTTESFFLHSCSKTKLGPPSSVLWHVKDLRLLPTLFIVKVWVHSSIPKSSAYVELLKSEWISKAWCNHAEVRCTVPALFENIIWQIQLFLFFRTPLVLANPLPLPS